jgi:hypothetical protein
VKKQKKKKAKKNKDGTSGERDPSGEVGGTGNNVEPNVVTGASMRSQSPRRANFDEKSEVEFKQQKV